MTPLECSFELILIQHPNELTRSTNTGKLLQWRLPNCQSYVWDRKNPPPQLLARLSSHPNPCLLFPTPESSALKSKAQAEHEPLFIVLDSTWQEAKKMWRQSPWLQVLPTYQLDVTAPSQFSLRRNQQSDSLCTAEVGIELLKLRQKPDQAQELHKSMLHYFEAFQADRSGHALR